MGGLGIAGAVAVIVALVGAVFGLFWWLFGLVTALTLAFIAVSLFMMLIILIQRPKGGGLSGAFVACGYGVSSSHDLSVFSFSSTA